MSLDKTAPQCAITQNVQGKQVFLLMFNDNNSKFDHMPKHRQRNATTRDKQLGENYRWKNSSPVKARRADSRFCTLRKPIMRRTRAV